jgi:hypothetical protein
MNDLLNSVIIAHGGLDRWNSFHTAALELSVGGALWNIKGQTGLLSDSLYEADTHKQRATLHRFDASDRRVRFAPDKLVLETDAGREIQVRDNPRAAFAGHALKTPWDQLHAAYFKPMQCGPTLRSLFSTPRRLRSSLARPAADRASEGAHAGDAIRSQRHRAGGGFFGSGVIQPHLPPIRWDQPGTLAPGTGRTVSQPLALRSPEPRPAMSIEPLCKSTHTASIAD